MKIGVLVSGNLGFVVLNYLYKNYEIEFVMTDKLSTTISEFCQQNKLNYFAGNPRNLDGINFYSEKEIDLLVSVNYLFIIEKKLIDLPKLFAFNIHGSLLPKYRGRTPHVWAIINNENYTGITAHLIDEGCDTGDIIEQIKIEIDEYDTGDSILKKFNNLYIPLLDKVLNDISTNSLNLKKQNNEVATYFGKRTPEDGLINWDWQKERLRNWVRAQSFPYPGSFTFFNNQKVVIDEIKYSELGFKQEIPNGTIVSVSPLCVKTPNGVIEIVKMRDNTINFETYNKLS